MLFQIDIFKIFNNNNSNLNIFHSPFAEVIEN
jgi:hypothetical protein